MLSIKMGETNFKNKEAETAEDANPSVVEDSIGATSEKSDKERIEKSRREVLDMIDKNKKGVSKGPGIIEVEKKENKIASWFKKIFDGPDVPSVSAVSATSASPAAASEPKKDSPMVFSNNAWSSAGVMETNLIDKNEYSFYDTDKKVRSFFVGVFATSFLVLACYLGILYWEHLQLNALKAKEAEIERLEYEVSKLEIETKDAKSFQKNLDVAVKILDKHIYWSNFFNFLESKVLSNVFFVKEIKLNLDGPFSFSARTDDYVTVKNQLIVLSEDERVDELDVSEVQFYEEAIVPVKTSSEVSSTTMPVMPVNKSGIEFKVEFDLDENIFYKKNNISDATEANQQVAEEIIN